MVEMCKRCCNSRGIASEKGPHYICCLPYSKALDCSKGLTDYFVPRKPKGGDV